MHKFTNTLTPAQVYRYAVECCQPHLKLRDAKRVTARMLLTILFAATARISSLSDTCKRLRGVPDEEVVAAALYETLPDYNLLKRQVNAALAGHLPKPFRKQAQIVAFDLTLLPFYGATPRRTTRSIAARPSGAPVPSNAYASAYIVHKGQRHGCAHGGHPQADDGGRDQGIAPPSPQGSDSRPVPGLGSRVLQRRPDPLFAGGADAVPDAGGGPRPQAGPPAGPQRLAGLQGDEAERLVRVYPERSSEAHGDGADLRQVPEPPRRAARRARSPGSTPTGASAPSGSIGSRTPTGADSGSRPAIAR